MDGNEYATKVYHHFAKAMATSIAEDIGKWLREAFGTGFCAGVAFAKDLPLLEDIEETN
jgi:hypothetical protein